jgi:hypothetical protein
VNLGEKAFRTVVTLGAKVLAGPVGKQASDLVFHFEDKVNDAQKQQLQDLKEQYMCTHFRLVPSSWGVGGISAVPVYVVAHNGCAFSVKGTWFWHPDPHLRILQADDFVVRYDANQKVRTTRYRDDNNTPGQFRRKCALCLEYYEKK